MRPKSPLHPVQQKLIDLLADNIDDPLTFQELQYALDVSSTSVVTHHIKQLEKKGYLKRNPYNPRDYQILKDEPESPVSHLNLYGLAACGLEESILDRNPIDRIPIASRLLTFPAFEAFMVKAEGHSMEPKIHEGDLVIARRTKQYENGKIYVCVNNGEALIKKIQTKPDVLLHSLNENKEKYSTFSVGEDFRVEGEVKAIISRKI